MCSCKMDRAILSFRQPKRAQEEKLRVENAMYKELTWSQQLIKVSGLSGSFKRAVKYWTRWIDCLPRQTMIMKFNY